MRLYTIQRWSVRLLDQNDDDAMINEYLLLMKPYKASRTQIAAHSSWVITF